MTLASQFPIARIPAGSFVTPERARPRPYASPHAQVGATFYETDRTRAVSEADLLAGKVDPAIGGSCGPIPKDWAEHDGTPAGATRPCAERLGMTRARRPSTYSETDRSVAVSEAGRARRATAIRLGSSERLWAAYDCLAHKSGRSSPATFLNAGHTPFIRRRTASGTLAQGYNCTTTNRTLVPSKINFLRGSFVDCVPEAFLCVPRQNHCGARGVEGATHG